MTEAEHFNNAQRNDSIEIQTPKNNLKGKSRLVGKHSLNSLL
jgi:hypothetical protein